MKVVVFDLGGTLMAFKGMPLSWADYYPGGFESISDTFCCNASPEMIEQSAAVLKALNPRINYRETEYAPELIFERCLAHWEKGIPIEQAIDCFFAALPLKTEIYTDSIAVIQEMKAMGYHIAALTDLPTAMPDQWFRQRTGELLEHIDLYVSSQSCGFRKPNCFGLQVIAGQYDTPIEKLLFVGDEEKDRLTAQNAGCPFIQIDRAGTNPNADIRNLWELIGYLSSAVF